jgi:uncharacterized protein (DUF302 family)
MRSRPGARGGRYFDRQALGSPHVRRTSASNEAQRPLGIFLRFAQLGHSMNSMNTNTDGGYGRSVTTALSFDAAVKRAEELLKDEGFGLLCEIDVSKTLHEKIGAEFRPYRILGACNPRLAHSALQKEAQLGLLLPCNVVVQELEGQTIVSAVDARTLLSLVGNTEMKEVADDVNARFGRVLDSIERA